MAKPTRRAATPPSDSESELDAASASNVKTEPDVEETMYSQSFGGVSSRDAESDDESDEDDDDDDDKVKGEGNDSDNDSNDSYASEDNAPIKPRQAFTSAPPRLAANAAKASASKNSSSSSDGEATSDGDSDSSSSSDEASASDGDSDSDDEDGDKSATEKPSSSKKKGKVVATSEADDDGDSSSSSSGSDSESESDSDSDSDSNEDESEDAEIENVKTENVKTEEAEEPSVPEDEADDTVVTALEAAASEEVDSSDDEVEDIPNILPPGTLLDVKGNTESGMVDAPEETRDIEEANEAKEVGEEEPLAEPTPDEEQPKQPSEEAPPAASPVPAPETVPASTRGIRQRSKRQVAKAPYVPDQEQAPAEEAPPADDDEAVVNGGPTAEAADAPGAQEVSVTPDEPPATKSPRKRKRTAAVVAEEEGDASPETPAPRSAKKRAVARTPASRVSAAVSAGGESSSKKGPQGNFEPWEVDLLETAAAKYMEENQISQGDFNEMVHDNAQKHTTFWDFMTSEFQNKKRLQVILRCRRIFHNFKQRYHWTDEQDAELAELVVKHGNKWSVIGAAMDRSSEDVRKRWDERVVCGDKVLLSYWRFDEEKRLGQIVGQVLREVQGSRNQDTATLQPSAVRDIPWHVVSERMDHTRTARQCRIKWRLIHEAYHFNEDGEFVGPPDPVELSNSQIKAERMHGQFAGSTPAKSTPSRTPAKKKAKAKKATDATDAADTPAETKTSLPLLGITPEEDGFTVPETARPINDRTREQVRAMTTEDKHRLVLSIRESNVGREDKIPWTRIVDVSYRKKYNRAARELVWSRLKRAVPNYHRKSVRQICEVLIQEYDANAAVGQGWDVDYDEEPEKEAGAGEAVVEAGEGSDSSAIPSSSAIVRAMAAAKDGKSTTMNGKRATRVGAAASGKGFKSNEFIAESDSNDADVNGDLAESQSSAGEAAEVSTQRRTRRGRATKLNGSTEKHVSESEAEDAPAEQTNEAGRRRATRLANAAATRAKKAKALTDIYSDIEGASTPSNSQPNTQPEDIEDADEEDGNDTGRRARAASVDLSMGEKLSEAEAGEEGQEGDGELPLTLSLSPGLARHKPTARSRPLNMSKQRRGNGTETNGSAQANRFLPPDGTASSATTSSKLTSLRPGEVRRTKKRSLTSAQWLPDPGSDGEGEGAGAVDEIEEVSDHDRARPSAGESLTARAARAALSLLPRSAKRMRQD